MKSREPLLCSLHKDAAFKNFESCSKGGHARMPPAIPTYRGGPAGEGAGPSPASLPSRPPEPPPGPRAAPPAGEVTPGLAPGGPTWL